ncbi:MAG: hemerythrin domain-containing protein [Actinoallomurus sp.]
MTRHHTGEDDHAFAHLAEPFPELRPVLAELRRDHEIVAGIMRDLQDLLGGLRADLDPAERQRVRAELDGLAALLESHFGYEERRLVSALNTLEVPEWAAAPPDFLLTSSDPGSE